MDLVYGNDGRNYRTFAKSNTISARAEQQILASYLKYVFPKNNGLYTSPEKEPESIFYVTSDLGRALHEDYAVLVKNGRMRGFMTPSFYLHAHLLKIDRDFYKGQFFDIFSMKFISDIEASSMTDESISSYQPDLSIDIQDDKLSVNQLKSVLYYFFYNDRLGKPVKIALDESGDYYNRRSREVLKAIYHYLPYDYRKRYGFVTYMDEKQGSVARVGFELYDRAQVTKINVLDIDLANCDSETIRNRIGKTWQNDYVDKLVAMDKEEREQHFDDLEQLSGGKRFNLKECLDYWENEESWKTEPVETLLPFWIDYVYENCMLKGNLYERTLQIIENRIDNDTYNEYLIRKINEENADLLDMPESIRRILMFADCVSGIEIAADDLDLYDAVYHGNRLGSTASLESVKKEYVRTKEEISKIKNVDLGIKCFVPVRNMMAERREEDLKEIERERDTILEQLKSMIKQYVESLKDALNDENAHNLLQEAKKYKSDPDLSQMFREAVGGKIREIISDKIENEDSTEREIEEAREFLKHVSELIEPKDYQHCNQIIDNRGAILEQQRRLKSVKAVSIHNRKDLIGLIKIVHEQESIQVQYPQEGEREICLDFGEKQINLKLSTINTLCDFLITPDKENTKHFIKLNEQVGGNELLLQFMDKDLFSADHVFCLDSYFSEKKYISDRAIRSKVRSYADMKDRVYNGEVEKQEFNKRTKEKIEAKDSSSEEKSEKRKFFGNIMKWG